MNYYFVTGTSSGLGKSLAELLLKDKNNFVTGFARNCEIEEQNYKHVIIDLGNLGEVLRFKFPKHEDADSVVLVNNAGTLGEVKPIGSKNNDDIILNYNINIVSPSIIINNFIKTYQSYNYKKLIINISSGAGRHPILSFGAYSASKAALDMYSRIVDSEQQTFHPENMVRIFSVAPGVIDTKMQEDLRKTRKEDFYDLEKFRMYKEKNILASPDLIAMKLLGIIKNPENYPEVIFDLNQG
ncbi:MAG: SDR family NAD(P)-dependent oxidoreductase [Bacteroidia bacterium]|nr:SDR family NAD(P)-dependent oxidoreductase [Bacteroidia bacterium]